MSLTDDLRALAKQHPVAPRRVTHEPASYSDLYTAAALLRLVDWSGTAEGVAALADRLTVLGDALDQGLTIDHTAAVAAYVAGRDAA